MYPASICLIDSKRTLFFIDHYTRCFNTVGPLGIQDIYFGIEHTLVKSEFPKPPVPVLESVLRLFSYSYNSGAWYWDGNKDEELNNGENIIMRTLGEHDGVAHHAQLAAAIVDSPLSFPSLHATLRRSPLFDNFEHSLYKLRGSNPSAEAIQRARECGTKIPVDLEYEHDLDGNIILQANIGTMAIGNGTLLSEHLPNLAGEWSHAEADGEQSTVRVTDNEIRGLRKILQSLGCQVGDRVVMTFATDTRMVSVKKTWGVGMTTIPNRQLVTIALGNLGAHDRAVHTEDIAIQANGLAPGRFNWRKYPERIDINVVLQGLGDARRKRYGQQVSGSNVKGWMLTQAGQIWVKDMFDRRQPELATLISAGKNATVTALQMELHRLKGTSAYKLHVDGRQDELTQSHLFEFARINEYFSSKARRRRLSIVGAAVYGDQELQLLWDNLKSTFESEFEE